jgi:hypothetical protein
MAGRCDTGTPALVKVSERQSVSCFLYSDATVVTE